MTGATGYLGSRLAKALLQQNGEISITIAKRSFSNLYRIESLLPSLSYFNLDEEPLLNLFKRDKFDLILHCATDYGRQQVPKSELLEANLLLPLRLLELGSEFGVKHFVNTDTMLDKGVSSYSLSKKQFQEWLLHFSEIMNTTTVLLEHFYGPRDDESKFVTYIVKSLIKEAPVLPLTTGEQFRDFIYIDDVVSAFLYILKNFNQESNGYKEYEVGSGQAISIREFVILAKRISKNNNTHLDFGALPYRKNEPMSVQVNTAPLRKLGWQVETRLEEGLRKTFEEEESSQKK